MHKFMLLLAFGFSFSYGSQTVELTTSSVTVTNPLKKGIQFKDAQEAMNSLTATLKKLSFVEGIEEAYKSKKISKKTETETTSSQSFHYFAQLKFPEAKNLLISFNTEQVTCQNSEDCSPSLKINLSEPFKFYLEREHFSLNNLKLSNISSSIDYTCSEEECSSTLNFEIKNLFLLNWLNKVHSLFNAEKNIDSHKVLLKVKDVFQQVGNHFGTQI